MISLPSKLGHADLSKPVNNSEEGDDDERGPPPPKDEEVVLVEHVVWEKAEEVVFLCGPAIPPMETSQEISVGNNLHIGLIGLILSEGGNSASVLLGGTKFLWFWTPMP